MSNRKKVRRTVTIDPETGKRCVVGDKTTALLRDFDGTVYAYRCNACCAAWKVYQQSVHFEGCEINERLPSRMVT